MGRIYIDRSSRLERTDLYRVRLTTKDGEVYEDLEPRRLFPISRQTTYISFLNGEEREVALARDLADLDEASRAAVEDCFAEYYLIPKVQRVIDCIDKFGSLKWVVETDRGMVSFRIRNRNIKCMGPDGHRVLLRDTDDNRYEIPDHTLLDSHSRHLLYPYL